MPFYGQDYIKNDPRIVAATEKAEFISHLMEGNAALKHNDNAGAVKSFRKAIKMNPGYYLPYTRLGFAFFKMEAYPEASAALSKSLELNSEQFDILYMLGTCFERMDMKKQAEEAFELARLKSARGSSKDKGAEERPAAGYKPKAPLARRKKPKPVSLVATVATSLKLIVTHPWLFIPFITYYFTTSLLTPVLNQTILGRYDKFVSFTKLNVNDRQQMMYIMTLLGVHMLVGIPLLSSTMVSIRNIYRSRSSGFRANLKQSYERLPALVFTMMITGSLLIGVYAVVQALGAYAVLSTANILRNEGAASAAVAAKQLYVNLAAIAATGLFAPFFTFTFQYLLIDKKSFEDALSLSFGLGAKHYFKTIALLVICGLPFLTIMKGAFSNDFKTFMIYRLPEIPNLCFAIVMITVFYNEARGNSIKKAKPHRGAGREDGDSEEEVRALDSEEALRESLKAMLDD